MSLYSTHILPHYLNWAMKGKDLKQHRIDVVSKVSGIGLEIGFGSGLNLPYYQNVQTLYALDPSNELYEIAAKNSVAVPFPVEHIQSSAEQIPLADNSLDFVISTWTLCSIPHAERALAEVIRVLKPGGTFSFIEHGKAPNSFTAKIQTLLTPFSKRCAGGCHLDRNIEDLIYAAGFEIKNVEKFAQKSKPLAYTYKGVAVTKK